jgi:hypothetical protein
VKPTKEKGPDKSVCFGYGQSQGKGFPQHCLAGEWCCYDGSKFVTESSITCTVYDPKEVDKRNVGAICIRGAVGGTGNRAKYLNGTFEITEERCNGMPVYQKKGDIGTWLEMVRVKAGGWRWYIKPTKEKGPDSSICFGYGVSNDVVFPHECDVKSWHCYDGTKFEVEKDIVASMLYPTLALPDDILALKSIKADEYATEKYNLEQELRRDCKPGAVEIKGAIVDRSKFVNGIFEPTDETCNGMPVYRKKGDPDTWLEMVKTASGTWRWYVKPTKERGPDKSICFGYGTSDDVVLPQNCKKECWYVYDNTAFVKEVQVTCELVQGSSLPQHLQDMAEEGRIVSLAAKNDLDREMNRPPLPGSVIIQGATVDRSKFVNGIFEPTKELCNGMTVYRKKGEPGIWLETVKTSTGWRWYVKPEKERGPEKSVCYGYGFNKEKVNNPVKCNAGEWCCYDDKKFVTEATITCTPIDDSQSLKGTLTISGAVGGTGNRAVRVNGTYEITTEVCNGMPVYRKRGDADTWLEMVKTKSATWRWYVKPTAEKGPDSSICFGYGVSNDVVFPHECDEKSWHCYDGSNFTQEEGIAAVLFPGVGMPEFALSLKAKKQDEWLLEKAGLESEVKFNINCYIIYLFRISLCLFLPLHMHFQYFCQPEGIWGNNNYFWCSGWNWK